MSVRDALLLLLIACIAIACASKHGGHGDPDVYYTCSMHPQVMEQAPGACPICKMPLVPARKSSTAHNDELHLNDQQILLGNIKVDTVREHALQQELLLPGRLAVDQEKVVSVSTRVMGRVEVLRYKNIGERVEKGAPIYAIYSEDLSAAVSELLVARDLSSRPATSSPDPERYLRAARRKLLDYGLDDPAIARLESLTQVPYTIEFLSPVSGTIIELPVREGETVMQGTTLIKVAPLSTLWAEAQVFPYDRPRVRPGSEVHISVPAQPGRAITSPITFASPELDPGSVIQWVRASIDNADGSLQPGMQAYLRVPMSTVNALAVPSDAVLHDGRGSSVWVSTAPGHFTIVMVTTGVEAGGYTEITDGLHAGDQVAVTGAYLLNSEYIFRKGDDPMAGMNM